MALMRRGVTDLNTEDPALLKRASDDLKELNEIARVKVTINGYETLPAGRMWLNQVWSGDMLNAVISYLPEGTTADVLSYWFQKAGGPVFNDCMCIGAEAEKPVHGAPVHELHARPEERAGELRRLRRLPAADHEDRRRRAVRAAGAARRTCATASSRARTTPAATRTCP